MIRAAGERGSLPIWGLRLCEGESGTLHLYCGNDRVSFGRFELKNHHAIPGIHFETLLIRGQRSPRGGCHIQIGHNLLPVREDVEDAVAGM